MKVFPGGRDGTKFIFLTVFPGVCSFCCNFDRCCGVCAR